MIKLIALDLDGTLMSADHLTISEENRNALKKAHEKGVKISISTGRTLALIGDICDQAPEIDFIMYSNGAGVFDRRLEESIYTNLLSWDFSEKVLDYLEEHKAFYEVYVDGKSYAQINKRDYFIDDLLPQEFTDALIGVMHFVDNVKQTVYGKGIEKISIYSCDTVVLKEMEEHFYAMNLEADITSSILNNIELTNKNVNKGTALDGMCRALGITADEVMAFGDAGNDIPMLAYAGYSFAMANGSDECKATAKYMAKSNVENGVALAIEEYVL